MFAIIKKDQFLLLFLLGTMLSCTHKEPIKLHLNEEVFIPRPVAVLPTESSFELNANTVIEFERADKNISRVATYLALKIEEVISTKINYVHANSGTKSNIIRFIIDEQLIGESVEGYQLNINEREVVIAAKAPHGLFNGVQTLSQLIEFGSQIHLEDQIMYIPSGKIVDHPLYEYRGAMLDVARHFFSKEVVFKYIDYLAEFKMNTLHLHLTDDQGWRIEIKSWPNLTEHGGSTQVGGGKGGFYTQEDYKEIVKYAADRFITIIPEIDMPGHTNAALASYPELNCNGIATELYTGTRVGFSTLCTDKAITYEFVDDVIGELSALTPGPYIHIGGDESHVTPLKDYIPFINRVKEIVYAHKKKMIGWDEIAHGNLDANTAVQYWSNKENSLLGISKGAKVMISPASRAYLDMKYDTLTKLGLDWAGLIEVDHAYKWRPHELVEGINQEDILGIEAPLWSETITNLEEIEFLTFPRLLGYAEIGWTQDSLRNWDNYKTRLIRYLPSLEKRGINYYRSPLLVDYNKSGE